MQCDMCNVVIYVYNIRQHRDTTKFYVFPADIRGHGLFFNGVGTGRALSVFHSNRTPFFNEYPCGLAWMEAYPFVASLLVGPAVCILSRVQ